MKFFLLSVLILLMKYGNEELGMNISLCSIEDFY